MTGDAARPVLFASEYYPPFAPGGAEWTNAEWAKALARRGQPVVVVTPNYHKASRASHTSSDGIDVIRFPFPIKLTEGQGSARGFVHRNSLWDFYFARQIADAALNSNAALIHAQGKGSIVGAWRASRALRLPVLATIRDLGLICPLGMCPLFEPWRETFDCSFNQYAKKCIPYFLQMYEPKASRKRRARLWFSLRWSWFRHLRPRQLLGSLDAVVGVSRGILSIFPENVITMDRRHVVYPLPPSGPIPIHEEVVATRRKLGIGAGPLVLYAGKHSLGKGVPVLLAALNAIRTAVPGVRFAFAGKGNQPPAQLDVHSLGERSQEELFRLFCAADVVVSPSVWPEPMSRILVEAMHFGRPVVATSTGGSAEAVEHGVTGLLVPKNDAAALADAIVALLRDPARRERMGAAARARLASVFSEDKIVASLLDAYAAAGRRPS